MCVGGGGGSVCGPCFVMQYLVSFLVCNHLDTEERERAGCFTLLALRDVL